MSKSHAQILADIASQVAKQYTTGTGGRFTAEPEIGQVPVPDKRAKRAERKARMTAAPKQSTPRVGTKEFKDMYPYDPAWDWTLDERYRP